MSAIDPFGPKSEAVSRLLRLALTPAVQPADLLFEHGLAQRDMGWLESALDDPSYRCMPAGGGPRGWVTAAPSAEHLSTVRVLAKRRFESAESTHARCAALFVYAWCVGASLVHRGTTGSSEPRDAVDGLLAAATAVAPAELRDFLDQAIAVETEG